MPVQSRRQTLAQMAMAVGALVLGTSVLKWFGPRRTSPGAPDATRAGAPSKRRVQPAPHAVKRNG